MCDREVTGHGEVTVRSQQVFRDVKERHLTLCLTSATEGKLQIIFAPNMKSLSFDLPFLSSYLSDSSSSSSVDVVTTFLQGPVTHVELLQLMFLEDKT